MLADKDLNALPMSLQMRISRAYGAAASNPKDADRLAALGALYYVHDFPTQSAECFRLASLYTADRATIYFQGLAHERADDTAAALAQYERLVDDPEHRYVPVYLRLADLLAPTDPARAAELYRQALSSDPLSAPAAAGLARSEHRLGNTQPALENFELAIRLEPSAGGILRDAADAFEAAGRAAEAAQYRRRAERAGPDPAIDDPLGVILLRGGLQAEVLCREALFAGEQGENERAELLLNQVQSLGTNPRLADETLAILRGMQKRYAESAEAFRRVLAQDPEALNVKAGLAVALGQSGQEAEAEQLLREVLAKQPDHERAFQRFNALMQKQNRPDEPLRMMEQATAAQPDNPSLRIQYAHTLRQQKRTDEALAQLREAVELAPEMPLAHHYLAVDLLAAGDTAGARAEWETALRFAPRFLDAYLGLASLAQRARDRAAVVQIVRTGLRWLPESHALANSLAWSLATAPEAADRNGAEALKWAQYACQLTNNADHTYLDTLAAAYAENGDFVQARLWQRRALELAQKSNAASFLQQYQRRLALYNQSQPFHE